MLSVLLLFSWKEACSSVVTNITYASGKGRAGLRRGWQLMGMQQQDWTTSLQSNAAILCFNFKVGMLENQTD